MSYENKLKNSERAIEFYNACYYFLKKRVIALGASEEEFKEGIRKPDFPCYSMEDVMRAYACIAQDKTVSCNVIQFAKNEKQIQKCLFDRKIDRILSAYSSSDELTERFVEEFKLGKKHTTWEKYAASIYGFCKFVKELKLLKFDDFSCYIQENSKTLKKRLELISRFDKIPDVGMAVAANFLKELGLPKSNSYSLYSKPDTHMLDIMHGCGFIRYRNEEDCFVAVDELSRLCDVSPYKIDKVFYCAKSGNYYLFRSIRKFEDQFAKYFVKK